MEGLPAKPVSYLHERTGIGRVFIASTDGPPLTVHAKREGDEDLSVCIEMEDVLLTAEKDICDKIGLPFDKGQTLRVAMHLPSARMLCCHLIEALASSGDKVAIQIQHMMRQSMVNVKAKADNLSPYEKEELKRELDEPY